MNRTNWPGLAIAGMVIVLASGSAAAHHSFAAAYDENAPLNMEGVVTKVELTNPHSWLWVDVTSEDGTVTNWGFEGGPPVNLFRHGLTRDTLPWDRRSRSSPTRPRAARTRAWRYSSNIWMAARSSWAVPLPAPTDSRVLSEISSRDPEASQRGVEAAGNKREAGNGRVNAAA